MMNDDFLKEIDGPILKPIQTLTIRKNPIAPLAATLVVLKTIGPAGGFYLHLCEFGGKRFLIFRGEYFNLPLEYIASTNMTADELRLIQNSRIPAHKWYSCLTGLLLDSEKDFLAFTPHVNTDTDLLASWYIRHPESGMNGIDEWVRSYLDGKPERDERFKRLFPKTPAARRKRFKRNASVRPVLNDLARMDAEDEKRRQRDEAADQMIAQGPKRKGRKATVEQE